ncbi:MAG: hypothetical protein ACOY3P_01575, partial [Planctomycetota bacterium]
GQADASIVIDFQSLQIAGTGYTIITSGSNSAPPPANVYVEDGFRLSTNSDSFYRYGTSAVQYSGSTALVNNGGNAFTTLTSVDGSAFAVTSINLAKLTTSQSNGNVTFTGERSGVVVATQTFTFLGSSFAQQMFNFPSSFNNVTSVSWQQVSPFHQFDNIVVDAAVPLPIPEPLSLAIWGGLGVAGIAVSGAHRRRKRRSLAA